ncbi:MAG TPA: hypothetical protein VMN60_13470 [Longimicrobiales bacterium]|nr:hypothetical protein [Longimicrobiales bacterium]
MNAMRTTTMMVAAALFLSACRAADDADTGAVPADTVAGAADDTGGMPGMGGTAGMQMGMMDQMMGHMQMMQGAGMDSMKALLPMHRQMLANMIAQMNREMRDMNMTMDAQWDATVDSLRSDLTSMPDMSAQELHAAMPAHHERVLRLMDMHRTMMKNMNSR